jgi:5-methylcytosine-specific restriction endonuclease McrA
MGLCGCGCGAETGDGKKFISGHNSRVRFKPRIEKACKACGETFTGTKAAIQDRLYCSSACRDADRRRRRGAENPSYKRVIVACAICAMPVAVPPNRLNRRPDQYCSPECGREGQRQKIKGVAKEASHWRTLAKRAYGSACVICGFDHVVEVHHIIPRSQGGPDDLDNLVPLCPNHHAMAHMGLIGSMELKARRESIRQ